MTKVKKTYRLDEEVVESLDAIAAREGVTATEALARAVEAYAEGSGSSEAVVDGTDWKSLYFAEKERADGMSAELLDLSGKVADSLQAAQVLQARSQSSGGPVLESADQRRKGRWSRLVGALRG